MVPQLEETSELKAGVDFDTGFSPEHIDPGNAVWTFARTPKIVSGVNETSCDRIAEFYGQLVDQVVPVSGTREAELAKLLENTFRYVNIALVSELTVYAAGLGIDIWEVIDAASTEPFGFMPFRPGPGVGGHCSVKGSRLLLLCVAYKKTSAHPRKSPARRIAELLDVLSADVRVADPLVEEHLHIAGIRVEPTVEELANADLVVVRADYDALDWEGVLRSSRRILDARRRRRGEHDKHI
jgi:UDP-N-acetyl-D-mannosaminuronate dehydrogenase